MKEYLKLQHSMLNRKMKGIGLAPFLGYLLMFIGFYWFSIYLFSKTDFAEYFYGLISISALLKLSEKRRNDFLKTTFSISNYSILRIIENLIMVFPFLIFLLYKQSFLVAIILFFFSQLISILNFDSNFNFTIPTPFSKKPFEFPIGFRKTFYVFPFAYFLTYQSIIADNFNLGIASMLLITFVVLSYYSKAENEYFVWSFNLCSRSFLINKIMIGVLFFSFLCLPIIVSLIMFYPNEILTLFALILLSYIYIITIILAKYSVYPNEINLPEIILIGTSIVFPPLLLGIIPFFYTKSIKQLKLILNND
jgi:hypothetical protein